MKRHSKTLKKPQEPDWERLDAQLAATEDWACSIRHGHKQQAIIAEAVCLLREQIYNNALFCANYDRMEKLIASSRAAETEKLRLLSYAASALFRMEEQCAEIAALRAHVGRRHWSELMN